MACTHLDQIRDVTAAAEVCEECVKLGDRWSELRLCMTCGHVGCCDSSKNRHATMHFRKTGHPIIQSRGSTAEWLWCYVDKEYIEAPASV